MNHPPSEPKQKRRICSISLPIKEPQEPPCKNLSHHFPASDPASEPMLILRNNLWGFIALSHQWRYYISFFFRIKRMSLIQTRQKFSQDGRVEFG